ncbi:MAG: ribonuclease R, partial [Alphaproteobacteria bacterium]|nr:ribonuclease R [Alphaproteobacteria bacterium]
MSDRLYPSLPTKAQILEFVNNSPSPVGKREIGKEFGVKGAARKPLKQLLTELQNEGLLERGRRRNVAPPGALPSVLIIDVVEIDADGKLICRPARWDQEAPPPTIHLNPGRRGR